MDESIPDHHYLAVKRTTKIVFFLVLLNLALLDAFVFKFIRASEEKITRPQPTPAVKATSQNAFCPQSCLTKIEEATVSSQIVPPRATSTTQSQIKEFFIPVGSGTGTSDEWKDIEGLRVIIDTARYGQIKEAYFEAAVHVDSGNQDVSIRLYNATDENPVSFSELFFGNARTPSSQTTAITLTPGNKAYTVQMKTQLNSAAKLDSARIRIITF